MKRFFFVFSIILILFLVLAAGTVAAVEYGSVRATTDNPLFVAGWAITKIPFYGDAIIYPNGDLFFIRQVSAQSIKQGDVILFSHGMNDLTNAGYVTAAGDGKFSVVRTDGEKLDVPAANLIGIYSSRIARMAEIVDDLKSLPAVLIFSAVLLVSVVLWCVLPGRRQRDTGSLSKSDGEIASNLY